MMYPKPTRKVRKTKRNKLPTIKKLTHQLDDIFAEYIRLRDGKCVLTGSPDRLTCSHLISRRKKSTRWDEMNCHAMTYETNLRHNYYPEYYTNWFIKTYGEQEYLALVAKSQTIYKPTRIELEDLIQTYTVKVLRLK